MNTHTIAALRSRSWRASVLEPRREAFHEIHAFVQDGQHDGRGILARHHEDVVVLAAHHAQVRVKFTQFLEPAGAAGQRLHALLQAA